ncbi:MAG: nucleotidyltransferase family protein [Anaerolineae bacterium]|nr:nucleotidyltransferase family protein [Anaerolineae bacterium]MDW8069458.1 nucleotidyltransferase family protein [Anaerolineae bacterium]
MNEAPQLAAVVLAGSSPRERDPLARHTQGRPKGLLPIAGRPMIAYVVEALAGSRYIQTVIVVGLPPEDCPPLSVPVIFLPGHGGLFQNAEAGIAHALILHPHLDGVVVSSADIPLLTPQIVNRFIEECLRTDHDVYYGVVERAVMERRFPASRRSYVHLREGAFAGGDIMLVRPAAIQTNRDLWQRLADARKSALSQARILGGIWPMLKLLVRRMTLAEAERRASRALNVRGRAVICKDPEVGMDVDKPFQLEIVRAELEERRHG